MSKVLINKKDQQLIYIKWQDAHSANGWMTVKEITEKINEEILVIEEVGWVLYEDDQEIHLCSRRLEWQANEEKEDQEYGLYQRIPKSWILKKGLMING